MRLSNFQRNIIKKIEEQHFDTQIKVKFFFGSRVNDKRKAGDILVLRII